MIRTNVFLTEEQREILKQISQQSGLPVAVYIRRAIDEYIDHKFKWNRELQMFEFVDEHPHSGNEYRRNA